MTDGASFPTPDDLARLPLDDLVSLASRLRRAVIARVAQNGGHLASNLGVVELTIALLRTFDFTRDRLIWDVGHQSYIWKLLTGRSDRFATLRQEGGLSGFPKRAESPYDHFETGHSSTSISAAAGLARALKTVTPRPHIVAVIGDGALSGGMAFEAMNDIGHRQDDVLVILNDNQMSINRAVGGLSRHLERVRLSRRYWRLKTVLKGSLEGRVGGRVMMRLLSRFKRHGRSYISANNVYFEQLGWRYYGPVDGHDLPTLLDCLSHIKAIPGPVLLHVLTTKGKGYGYAESRPDDYHGVAPFVIEKGLSRGASGTTFSSAFCDALLARAAHDPRVVALSAAMTAGTGLTRFADAYPERFYDVGIAEQHAMTLAAGMAAGGLRPVVALYSTFLQRAYDQWIHDVCLQNLPVVLAIDRAGAVGADGPTHQGFYDLAMAVSLPNVKVFAPANPSEMALCVNAALDSEGPTMVRYPRAVALADPWALTDPYALSVEGEGTTALMPFGVMRDAAREAACTLAAQGVPCCVILTLCANPIDVNGMLKVLNTTDRLLLIEDGVKRGGLGTTLASALHEAGYDGDIRCLGHDDTRGGQASRERLLERAGLTAAGIVETVMTMITRSKATRHNGYRTRSES